MSGPPDGRRTWLRAVRSGYLAAAALLLASLVWTRRAHLADLVTTARPTTLALVLVLAVLQLLPSVSLWTVGLRHLAGRPVPAGVVLRATARSVPARYLPGSVWYPLGRAALLRRDLGLPATSLGTVAILEAALAVVVAIGAGTGLLAAAGRLPSEPIWLAGWFAVLLGVGSPPVVNALLRRFRRDDAPAIPLTWTVWTRMTGVIVLHWAASAVTFLVYLSAFPGVVTAPATEVAGSFLVGWVAGFLAVFAPQGTGVFEATVAAMLTSDGIATGAVIVAGYRVVTLVRDVVVYVAAGRLDAPGSGNDDQPEG